jgi:membrane fusion protein (multidrug efflux system)
MNSVAVNSMNNRKNGTAILAASLAVVVSGCGIDAPTGAEMDATIVAPMPVEIVLPVRAEISATYHTTTTIVADADASVSSRAAGEVVEILVEEGDQVVQGQVLARLDGDRLRLEMDQVQANLQKTQREFERSIRLHERGLVSSAAFEALRFDMDALQASYELKKLDYDYTTIRAPISGVISARNVKLGQHISSGDTPFRITDTSNLIAYLKIPQSELVKFAAGNQAEIHVDAMPDRVFTAQIARISPTVDSRNGTFRATAYLNNDAGLLAPGMFGRFTIAYEKHGDALIIPAAAVLEEDNETVVYIVDNGAAVRRAIDVGIEENGLIEVLSGVQETDQIVMKGQGSLREGSKVLASIPTSLPIIG